LEAACKTNLEVIWLMDRKEIKVIFAELTPVYNFLQK
jgi:hypothetical protein